MKVAKFAVWLALAGLLSCGSPWEDEPDDVVIVEDGDNDFFPEVIPFVDDEFKPYYDSFNKEYNVSVYHIGIEFDHIDNPTTAGICYKYANGTRKILIDIDKWAKFDFNKREVLIYHELGHCYFDRGHSNGTFNSEKYGNIPDSIMNSTILRSKWYEFHKEYYIHELDK